MSRVSLPRVLLQAEGAALLAAAVILYWALGGPWWVWLALLLAPDVCFVAFLAGRQAGTRAYNAVHTTVGPLLLGAAAVLAAERAPALVALIWLAHIGMDRVLGFGLKYPGDVKDTHFRRL